MLPTRCVTFSHYPRGSNSDLQFGLCPGLHLRFSSPTMCDLNVLRTIRTWFVSSLQAETSRGWVLRRAPLCDFGASLP